MSPELTTLIEHGGLVIAMWLVIQTVLVPLITRLMNRLDSLTDELLKIAQHQETIIRQQADIIERVETQRGVNGHTSQV